MIYDFISVNNSFCFMDIQPALKKLAERVYHKRNIRKELDVKDLIVLLADTILDQRFFKSPNWDSLYGGVRYIPYRCQNIQPQRILVIQWPAAIGDLAMAASFLADLRELYPGSEISFLADSKAFSIYGNANIINYIMDNPLNGYLDQLLEGKQLDVRGLISTISELVKTLTARKYDLAINLQILPQSAVLTRLAGAKENLGMTLSQDGMPTIYGNIWFPYLFGVSSGLMRRFNRLHRTEIFRRFINTTGAPSVHLSSLITQESIRKVQELFNLKGIKDNDLVIGLNPMANWPTRIWPKFGALARVIEERYGAKVFVFGSRDDKEVISKIVKSSNSNAIKVTHLDLNELMAAICGCDLFITNDTGPMHLACLLKKKVVALFGPTSIREVGPWGACFVALQSNICSGCYQYRCDKEDFCMEHISIEDVVQAAECLINQKKIDQKKISSNVEWFSSNDTHAFFNDVDDVIAGIHLSLLENRYSSGYEKEPVSTNIKIAHVKTETLKQMFHGIRHRLENTMKTINTNNNDSLIKETDTCLVNNSDYLKNIIVLNSMRFLDKRPGTSNSLESYKRYYSGISGDVEYFLSCLE